MSAFFRSSQYSAPNSRCAIPAHSDGTYATRSVRIRVQLWRNEKWLSHETCEENVLDASIVNLAFYLLRFKTKMPLLPAVTRSRFLYLHIDVMYRHFLTQVLR
jgi:hypothetical protein